MIKKTSKASLADKISDVLRDAPTTFNPDDEVDDTTAKLADFAAGADEDSDQVEEALLSKYRAQTVDLLGDVDQRYAGKKGTRKDFQDDSFEEEQPDAMSSDESVNEEEGERYSDSEDPSDEDESQSNGELSDVAPDEANFQHFSQSTEANQVNKGVCVRNQLNKWESLLEMRIQMQKCLMAANKLPQKAHFMLLDKEGEGFRDKAKEVKKNVQVLLEKFLQLQNLGIKQYPETKRLTKRKKDEKVNGEESDEEITSSSDEGGSSGEESDSESLQKLPEKRRKIDDFEKEISTVHDTYKEYRNQTIENWNSKTRSAVLKNSGQSQSVVSQINYILSDRNKLVKKTQLKKSEFQILGLDNNTENTEEPEQVKQVEEYNSEIFDDTDFYHQMLRELIEAKSTDITDPVQLGRQWIQLQSLRSKMKRKVDTRATKGRKVRYAVHSKSSNFMAPMDAQTSNYDAQNELFNSVFGKIHKRV